MEENAKICADRPTLRVNGVGVWQGLLGRTDQTAILNAIATVVAKAPFFRPSTPSGRPMSVEMTSAGEVGWITDKGGYRYEATHPNGQSWPEIPSVISDVWHTVTGLKEAPTSCLINHYRDGAKMGLHQDKDEGDFSWPVVSVSLGDDALFRVGGLERKAKTQSIWLASGDVAVLRDQTRLAFHGIDRIRPGSSKLVPGGGRINLTMRLVVDQRL